MKHTKLIAPAAATLLLSLASCSGGSGAAQAPGAAPSAVDTTVSVTTVEARRTTLHDYVNTNGEIECESSVDCFPDIGGKVARVYVSLGDRVSRGDVIAEIDPNEPGTYYQNSSVVAPISGTITQSPVEVGTTVSTSTAITTVGDISHLRVRANIPERYVASLRAGLRAEITLEAYPGVLFGATVSHVSPVLDSLSRTKEILLSFDESDSRVNAGMFAEVKLYTVDYEGELVVPSSAITTVSDVEYAYVLSSDGGTALRREVTTGESVDLMTQVTSGIEAGERVIVQGITSLTDGSPVRDITASSE